jgi:WhiB family transcriptional regulator, redox-sensing transcriptional regulator
MQVCEQVDMSWQKQAACLGLDPDLFFPDRGDMDRVREAKAVCGRCPVRSACLDYALKAGEKHGIFGGKSERERRQMRRQMREAS